MYVTRTSRYTYSVQYYLQFHVSAVGLGTFYLRIRGSTCISGTHFCYRLSQPQDHRVAAIIMAMKNSNGTIRNLTCGLLACSIVPEPTVQPCAPG